MLTIGELKKYIKNHEDSKEIVIISKSRVCDNIERVFIDTETGNIVLTVGISEEMKNSKK